MKCKKCGTPIIPGEEVCRFCGNKADFIERTKEPEIIDLPDDSTDEEVSIDLPDLDNLLNDVEIKSVEVEKEQEEIKKEESEIEQEEIKKEESEIEQEEIKKEEPEIEQEEIKKEEAEKEQEQKTEESGKEQEQKIEEPALEQPKEEKSKAKEKPQVVEEKPEKEGKLEKPKINIGIILLLFLLLCSVIGNIYLYITNSNQKATVETENKTENKVVYSKISHDNYKITIPSTWITENKDKNLLLYDDTQNWSASIQIVENSNYDDFVTNKDDFVSSLGSLKYQFTSNYSKQVGNSNFYLFKGKYYNYSVYVITTKINDQKMLVTDLKFKGEVDDLLLNEILTTMTTAKDNDTAELFKDNFEFKDISNQISSAGQN